MSFCTQQQESSRGERFLWSARLSAQLYNSFSGLPAVALHTQPAARFVNYDVLDIFFVAAEVISSGRHNRVSFFLHCFAYSFPLFKRNAARHNISIHALREEGDSRRPGCPCAFLSTPSARRATTDTGACGSIGMHFYPRPPRGGRHLVQLFQCDFICISIHALREEGDSVSSTLPVTMFLFLSTPSARKATIQCLKVTMYKGEFLSTPSARKATDIFGG